MELSSKKNSCYFSNSVGETARVISWQILSSTRWVPEHKPPSLFYKQAAQCRGIVYTYCLWDWLQPEDLCSGLDFFLFTPLSLPASWGWEHSTLRKLLWNSVEKSSIQELILFMELGLGTLCQKLFSVCSYLNCPVLFPCVFCYIKPKLLCSLAVCTRTSEWDFRDDCDMADWCTHCWG